MREIIAGVLFVWLFGMYWFPQRTGHVAHQMFNELRIGWDSVQ